MERAKFRIAGLTLTPRRRDIFSLPSDPNKAVQALLLVKVVCPGHRPSIEGKAWSFVPHTVSTGS
jgi:hypothetical protein